MLGYLYQCRLALADSVSRLHTEGSFSVEIETLDDVVFESDGAPTELLQAKHHIEKEGGLSDASPDLWKTLRIWVEGFKNGRWPTDTVHYLITTGAAQASSIAAYLRQDNARDEETARDRLDSVAISSTNQDNKSAYDIYLSIPPEDRLTLLERMIVCDRHPDILGVQNQINQGLALTVKREFVPALVTRLEGWWLQRVIVQLRNEASGPIYSEELDAELERLRQQFRDDNLPIDSDIIEAEIDESTFATHIFVEQLRLIDLTTKRILNAMRQYYRASEQRSRWLREGFLLFGELESYDRRLCEEWEVRFDAMTQELGTEGAEHAKREAARSLYKWAEVEASFLIRPAVSEPFVTRGSLQMLSDGKKLGWHPQFIERLESMVSGS